MGFFTVLPGNRPDDDDMLFYADDATADGNGVVTDLTKNRMPELSIVLIDSESDVSANLTTEIQIVSSPSIISSDSSITLERSNKRTYRCRKCGAIKKGHICPLNSSVPEESSVIGQPSEGSRMAANRENLSRLAQGVEGDNSADPDWVAPRGIDASLVRTSQRLRPQKRPVATIITETDEDVPPRKVRKLYECRNCHVPLKGHKCPHKLLTRQVRQLAETARVILDRVDQE